MPHLILEYSSNLSQEIEFSLLFPEMHRLLGEIGGIHVENCKSRAVRREAYYIGHGEPANAFIHLTVQILEGKPPEMREALGNALLGVLKRIYAPSAVEHRLQITVEIREMQRAGYFKAP